MGQAERIKILLVDDERVIRDGCARALACEEYDIHQAQDGKQGVEMLAAEPFHIVLLDLMMPGMDGFEVLRWIKSHRPDIIVIVVTGFATVAKAVEAMKQGAFDFVGKPFTPDYIRLVVRRACEQSALRAEALKLREEKSLDLETIAQEQSRLKTVFACMEGAIMVTNAEAVVVLHNPAAIRMLEIQTDPVIGKPLSESIRDPGVVSMVKAVIAEEKAHTREFTPGAISRLYLRAHCAPVKTVQGMVVGSVTVFEDVTTQKRVDEHKNEFVAMVAHDLRAPLASIVQMIYAIRSTADDKKRAHLLDRISVRLKDQLQMIENLLSLSRLDTGALELNLEPIDGDELIQQALDAVQTKADGKNINLQYQSADRRWRSEVDRDQIGVVLNNIVDNAVKYTPDGGDVTISSSSSNSLARILVADTGIGIKPEDLPHIFDRFFRVKGKDTRGITGSGLGLSLVKKIIEAHHGSIEVDSVAGKGTQFTICLPVSDAGSEESQI